MQSTEGRKELQLPKHGEEKHRHRFLSKDSSWKNPSFRVYYSVTTGAVPFQWEIRPGTPIRHTTEDCDVLPPLTPPPSYLNHPTGKHRRRSKSKPSFFAFALPRLFTRQRKQKHESTTRGSPATLTSSSTSAGSDDPASTKSVMCFGVHHH